MKVRHDFVTNSSSSSFIIARHKDCTADEVKTMLNEHRADIKDILRVFEGELDCGLMDAIKEAYDNHELNKAIDFAIDCLTGDLMYDNWQYMKLDQWNVNSEYASNEDDSLFGNMLYECGSSMSTEHLKIMRGS